MIQLNKILKSFSKVIDQFEQLAAINNVEVSRITKDKGALIHDDRLDALAGAVAYWVVQMGRDTEKAAQAHKEMLLDQELERFRRSVLGAEKPRKGWITPVI